MYLFITGTKFLSFATRLLQQEARPQGDLEQIMVVYFTKKRSTLPQQQELHKPATILLRTSCNLMRAFGLQKVFIHSSILCSFPILHFNLQNRFHPSYVIFLNFRLSTNHPLPSCLLPLLSCTLVYQSLPLLLPAITVVIRLSHITVFCNNFWFPIFLLISCLHTFSTLNFPCFFYSVSFSVSSLCSSFSLLKPHIPWTFLFFKSSK